MGERGGRRETFFKGRSVSFKNVEKEANKDAVLPQEKLYLAFILS